MSAGPPDGHDLGRTLPIRPEPHRPSCSICGNPTIKRTCDYCTFAEQHRALMGGGASHLKYEPGQPDQRGLGDPRRSHANQHLAPMGSIASHLKNEPDQYDLAAPRRLYVEQNQAPMSAAAPPFLKHEPYQFGQHGLDPRYADFPPYSDPGDLYSQREQDAIRNLLDVPAVEIPVSHRQREPTALDKTLMPHQHIGLTWLLNQEKSALRGGILADDMGLGKTIQAIALMLCHPPQDGTRKTTLIVVPTSLLRQWEREIDDKVKASHKLKTIIYHSVKKRTMTVAKLMSYDVVLTTYGTLAFEWKQVFDNRNPEAARLLASHAVFHRVILDEAHNIKNRNSQASKAVDRLHATYRLCMTGTPLMNRLEEIYPLIRFLRVEPYREWHQFKQRLMGTQGGGTRSMTQLHVLLGRMLLRRTEKTIVDGNPILNLPELTVHTVEAAFDKDQLEYYKALEQRSQIRMNRYLKEGTVTRNYWYILLLILRLRQCCCHPHLIKDHTIPEGVDMTPEEMNKLAHKLTKPIVDRIRRQRSFECPMCHEKTESPVIIYPCGHHVCGDCITNMVSVREPGLEFEDDEGGDLMGQCPTEGCTKSVDSKQVICYRYFSEVHTPIDEVSRGSDTVDEDDSDEDDADEEGNLKDFVVSDNHDSSDSEKPNVAPLLAGEPSIKNRLDSARPETGSDSDDSEDSLPPIDSYFSHIKKKTEPTKSIRNMPSAQPQNIKHQKSDEFERFSTVKQTRDATNYSSDIERNVSNEDGSIASGQKRKISLGKAVAKPRKKLKGGKKQRTELTLSALKKSGSNSVAAKKRYFDGLRKDWETSAKIDKAMELLGMIRRDFPNEKTLVFSQFTSFLDLMEVPISDDGYNYRRYDGSMPNGDREAAVDDFMKKDEVKIMLISLRCGNAGLNLYAATRVIMLDPFWNPSVEDQAIKRAHRMGQNNPVIAYRVLVKETVEDRILALQESKRQLVSDVLNPEARKGVSRLTVAQIAGLFGINWRG